jgi:hypothetical protein
MGLIAFDMAPCVEVNVMHANEMLAASRVIGIRRRRVDAAVAAGSRGPGRVTVPMGS